MQSYWTVYTDTETDDHAVQVIQELQGLTNRRFDAVETLDYENGGHEVRFEIAHPITEWATMVYDVIELSQAMGHRWIIAGGVNEEFSLTTKHPIPGDIKMITCWCSWRDNHDVK